MLSPLSPSLALPRTSGGRTRGTKDDHDNDTTVYLGTVNTRSIGAVKLILNQRARNHKG